MTDLPARLQEALGDAYHLDRELGGGGMSRLFIATERSLNRQVVVKVLPPELTSEVSAARFKQEIEVAAKLQHPHIVPILGAGASGDLLYYIMPYVRGESLRQRLISSGKIPIDDAVRILGEVSRALGYAHRQGIVHRDIKPENILLEDGQAVLADFGVARAIVAARTSDAGAEQSRPVKITGTGMSVGTPTYMAPEQAAGEGNVDARADLYALGVVGYEMMTGQHPFAATSAQKMIVAHLTLPAPPVAKLRPETPAAVSATIARTLAKEPAERFQSAEDFRAALDGKIAQRRGRRPLVLFLGALVTVALMVSAVLYLRGDRAVALDENLVAVAPFDIVDPDLQLWREGMVDVLSRNLDGAGPLRTVSPSLVVRRWVGRADKESAVTLGRTTGARLAVFGTLVRAGADSVSGSASVVDTRTGNVLGEVRRGDSFSRMERLSDSLTVALLRELGKSRALAGAEISSVGTTSLPALKAFLQAEQFFRRSVWDSAITYYERALATDSQFSIALMHEGEARGWSSRENWGSLRQKAGLFNHNLSPRDSILIEAGVQFGNLYDSSLTDSAKVAARRRLFVNLREAIRRYPYDPELWEKLGDAQVHWAGDGIEIGVPEVLRSFDRAISLDSAFTPAYDHATTLAFRSGTSIGRRYLRAYLDHIPPGTRADGLHLVDRITDPARQDSSAIRQFIESRSEEAVNVAMGILRNWPDPQETALKLERVAAEKHLRVHPEDSLSLSEAIAMLAESRGHTDEMLHANTDFSYVIELAGLGLIAPASTDSMLRGKWPAGVRPSVAIAYMGFRGDTTAINQRIQLFKSRPQDETIAHRKSLPYYEALARGFISLARHDSTDARREFSGMPANYCFGCAWPFLPLTRARLLSANGQYAEADSVLNEAGVNIGVAATLFELEHGRIAEKRHDKTRARQAYTYVADMWRNGEPAFQVYVEEAKTGLRRLSEERAGTPIPIGKQGGAH